MRIKMGKLSGKVLALFLILCLFMSGCGQAGSAGGGASDAVSGKEASGDDAASGDAAEQTAGADSAGQPSSAGGDEGPDQEQEASDGEDNGAGEDGQDWRDDPEFQKALEEYERQMDHPVVTESFGIGDTWTVEGQWELSLDRVEYCLEADVPGPFRAEDVYVVTYTYTNTGYEDPTGVLGGLYMYIDGEITDSAGARGVPCPMEGIAEPACIGIGESCTAQAAVALEHGGDFTLHVTEYDTAMTEYDVTFRIKTDRAGRYRG